MLHQVVALTILLKLGNVGKINHDLLLLFSKLSSRRLRLEHGMTQSLLLVITLMLEGNFFFLLHLLQKLRKQWSIQGLAFLCMLALMLAPLFEDQIPLFFRTSMDLSVVVSDTFEPLPVNKGIDDPHIIGLEAHRSRVTSNVCCMHTFIPVLQSVDGDSTAGVDLRDPCAGRGPCLHQKGIGVGNDAMRPCSGKLHPLNIRFAWTHEERGMLHLIITLMDVVAQLRREAFYGPDRQALWIDVAGKQPRNFTGLRIATKLLNKISLRFSKETLNHRSCMRFKSWTLNFCDKTLGK